MNPYQIELSKDHFRDFWPQPQVELAQDCLYSLLQSFIIASDGFNLSHSQASFYIEGEHQASTCHTRKNFLDKPPLRSLCFRKKEVGARWEIKGELSQVPCFLPIVTGL